MIERNAEEMIGRVAEMIREARRIVVFTGAGVSTESGIPDFRSPGGFWTKFDPEDFTIDKFLSSPETRRKQWRFLLSGDLLKDASPNAAHKAIVELETLGRLDCVITQNIDNLHQKAGNAPEKVYELHGSMSWIRCLECDQRFSLEEILDESGAGEEAPACQHCGGILKPDVIFFGEALPAETLEEATGHATCCDLMVVIGSSLVVHPAALLPVYAKQSGAKLVIVNLTPTSLDQAADVVINGSAGAVMGRIVTEVGRRVGEQK
jgi:NAD-dependent deacetylase